MDVLRAHGTRAESGGSEAEFRTFLADTFAHAGEHFRRGSPGNWRSSAAFSPEVAQLFASRYQCLLSCFRRVLGRDVVAHAVTAATDAAAHVRRYESSEAWLLRVGESEVACGKDGASDGVAIA